MMDSDKKSSIDDAGRQNNISPVKAWIEAMRLRTLPVSLGGVVAAAGCAVYTHTFNWLPFLICLVFAILAQITSNFANEYFDYRNGLDRKGRDGFRRGVTEGDITPAAMRNATFGLLLIDCLIGLSLVFYGGWWLIAVGIAIALFALGYSAGPYPLSHHGLGEIAVIIFFGIVPVVMTCYVQSGNWIALPLSLPVGVAVGLMGANVLIVNNYRDVEDDRAVGKRTLAVIFGRKAVGNLYFINGLIVVIIMVWETLYRVPLTWQLVNLVYINQHYILWQTLRQSEGAELNKLLGKTAGMMCVYCIAMLIMFATN